MPLSFPCLICKKCGEPTPLLLPKHPGTLHNRPSWPMDALPRNFLCSHCKRVFEYSLQDIQHRIFDSKDLGPLHKGSSVASVEVPCDTQGCAARIKIHAVIPFDADLSNTIPELLSEAIAHALPCRNGHLKYAQCNPEFVDDARFDEDWATKLWSA